MYRYRPALRILKVLFALSGFSLVVKMMVLVMNNHSPIPQEVVERPEFAIIVCRGENVTKRTASDFQRQLRQISVLLKSAAALTSQTLIFNIACDSLSTYQAVTNLTQYWPDLYKQRIVFGDYKEIFYPPGTEKIKYMFRPCSTGRLLLAQTYENKDAMVYIDSDTLFLKPPEDLWRLVHTFNSSQMIGIAPLLYMYGPGFKKFPTYGSSGLNAGVLLMNLTRIRGFEGGWTDTIMDIVEKYNTKLSLADQDILNVLFSNKTMVKHLYELGCEWNYRYQLCAWRGSRCRSAEEVGAGLLHGAAYNFVSGDKIFRTVFSTWEEHPINSDEKGMVNKLWGRLKWDNNSRGCSGNKLINKIFLQGLNDTLKMKDEAFQ